MGASEKPLSVYVKEQIQAIVAWKSAKPGVATKAFAFVTAPLVWLVQIVVPNAAIRGALDGANWLGEALADTGDIKRDGDVDQIEELRKKSLKVSDGLANGVHNWAIALATAEGAAVGAAGLPGLAIDVPFIVTLGLRTIHKIGLCYGYECRNDTDKNFVLGVMAASGANSMKEKTAALLTLRSIEVMIAKQTWKAMAEKAATERLSREGAVIAVKELAKQLGSNLTKRKAAQAIPVLGAGVAASVNGWFVKDIGWAARRAFQERWLIDNHLVLEI